MHILIILTKYVIKPKDGFVFGPFLPVAQISEPFSTLNVTEDEIIHAAALEGVKTIVETHKVADKALAIKFLPRGPRPVIIVAKILRSISQDTVLILMPLVLQDNKPVSKQKELQDR